MPVTDICHSDVQIAQALAHLRPRGEAWRNGGFDALDGSTMGGFFAALGATFGPTDRRFCDLIDQFFCSTATETLDLWALEHSVPDGCDPFEDVCAKVNAVGDTVPAYAEEAALRRGWSIAITQEFITVVEDGCYGFGLYGTQLYAAEQGVAWRIVIDLAASPAYRRYADIEPLFGLMLYADSFDCGPDIEGLKCLVRRIGQAHADLIFETVN